MPQFGLYDLLPLVIRLKDAEASDGPDGPILQRIFSILQTEKDNFAELLLGMRSLLSISSTSDLVLSFLADYLGVVGYSLSEVVHQKREYVAGLANAHHIKGTLLSILREMRARNIAPGTFIQELWKSELYAVDEYSTDPDFLPYESAMPAARVVFVETTYDDGPPAAPSDGSTVGIFAAEQVPYSVAKRYRERLNNVFPIHVLVPVPTIRTVFGEEVELPEDDLTGRVYFVLDDKAPPGHDSLVITFQCVAACQMSCQERCEVLCELTCQTNCETTCQASCEKGCQALCQTFCQNSCEGSCEDPCQAFCQSGCEANCQSNCQINCQQQCQYACQSSNEGCQSFCETTCQSDKQLACGDSCQSNCQSSAQAPCDGAPQSGEGG